MYTRETGVQTADSATGDCASAEAAEFDVEVVAVPLSWSVEAKAHPRFERRLEVSVRPVPLLTSSPWVRSLGKLAMEVSSQGWRFPLPPDRPAAPPRAPRSREEEGEEKKEGNGIGRGMGNVAPDAGAAPHVPAPDPHPVPDSQTGLGQPAEETTRLRPPRETVVFKDRLLYLLQPPLESLFGGCSR
jgi:hypothetical protein